MTTTHTIPGGTDPILIGTFTGTEEMSDPIVTPWVAIEHLPWMVYSVMDKAITGNSSNSITIAYEFSCDGSTVAHSHTATITKAQSVSSLARIYIGADAWTPFRWVRGKFISTVNIPEVGVSFFLARA